MSLNGNTQFFLAVLISWTSREHFAVGTSSADPVSLTHYAVLALAGWASSLLQVDIGSRVGAGLADSSVGILETRVPSLGPTWWKELKVAL